MPNGGGPDLGTSAFWKTACIEDDIKELLARMEALEKRVQSLEHWSLNVAAAAREQRDENL